MIIFCFIILANLYHITKCQQYTFETSVRDVSYANADNYGYRYCAFWRLVDGTTLYSTCDPYKFMRCGRYLEYEYKCCTGFKRIGPPIFGLNRYNNERCAYVVPQYKSCPDIIKALKGFTVFSSFLRTPNMISNVPTETHTIFAPLVMNQHIHNSLYGSFASLGENNPVFYHVVKGKFYARDLRHNQELESVYRNQKLKVTKYAYGVICIDCAELVEADLECNTGLVHQIRRVLVSRSGTRFDRTNLLRALQTDSRTSAFAADLPSDIRELLSNTRSNEWYTVFAPSAASWRAVKNRFSGEALANIVRNHIVKKLHCSAAFFRSIYRLDTLAEEAIYIECLTEDRHEIRYITDVCGNKHEIVEQDMMSSNGVVHLVKGTLVPLRARSLQDLINDPQCGKSPYLQTWKWFEYIKGCDLRMRRDKKYTILLPTDASFDWWSKYPQFRTEYQRFLSDKEYRCRVARYHIIEWNGELQRQEWLWHEQKGYKTNNVDLLHECNYFLKEKDASSHYFHYSKVANFENFYFAQGSYYRLNRINVIPEKFIVDIINNRRDLTFDAKFFKLTNFDATQIKPNRPLNLFLATVDRGFRDSRDGNNVPLVNFDKNYINSFLLLHTVKLYLWGDDIGYFKPNTVHRFVSALGIELIFHMDEQGTMSIGYDGLERSRWARVIKFNIHAIDGIIWLLDRFLPCPKRYCALIVEDLDLFDVYVSSCQFMELPGVPYPRNEFQVRPIKIAQGNPEKCVVYKQPTWEARKRIVVPT